MFNIILICCLDLAFTKSTYEKNNAFKDISFDKNKTGLQTNDSTLGLITKKENLTTTVITENVSTSELTTNEPSTAATVVVKSSAKKLLNEDVPCTCGIFLSSQFVKGSPAPPKGEPIISTTLDRQFVCNSIGRKQCQTKCLEQVVQAIVLIKK